MKMALQWHSPQAADAPGSSRSAAGTTATRSPRCRSPTPSAGCTRCSAGCCPSTSSHRAPLVASSGWRTTPSWWRGSARPGPCMPCTRTPWPPSSSSRCCRALVACTCTAPTCWRCCTSWPGSTGRSSSTTRSRPGSTAPGRSGPVPGGAATVGSAPDILCVGKALTGGYLSLAAVLCTRAVAEGVSAGEAGGLMHGPTFMANPLACAIASANLDLLASRDTGAEVTRIEGGLTAGLERAASLTSVAEVRVLGAVGVVQLREPVRRGRGDGGRPRAGRVGAAVPRPRLHDAAVRHG